MGNIVHLSTPLTAEGVQALELDDIVYLSGEVYTMMYPSHFTRLMDMMRKGEPLPMELAGRAIYNTGTIFCRDEQGRCDLRAIGTTTSSKFNAYTPDFIRLSGIRAVLGKGGMDRATLEAMEECGCVYLAAVGGCSAIYTPGAQIEAEYWPQLSWADNQLKLRMIEFGPLFVGMDAKGNSIYENSLVNARDMLPQIYQKLGIDSRKEGLL